MICDIDSKLQDLEKQMEGKEEPPYSTYYDDVCLARFLKGVALREQAYPHWRTLNPPDVLAKTLLDASSIDKMNRAAKQFDFIVLQADLISLDHWILPYTRYECGQLVFPMVLMN